MISKTGSVFIAVALFSLSAWAKWDGNFIHVNSQKPWSLTDVAGYSRQGQVIIISEKHDFKPDHDNQVAFLNELGRLRLLSEVSVAMEFLDYTQQDSIDKFLNDNLTEKEFLKAVNWGSIPFDFYRQQFFFPSTYNGQTYGINLPKAIASKLSKSGLDGLTKDERAMLPSNFVLGNKLYRERFEKVMSQGQHQIEPQEMDNYFTAMSAWDDTMAWKISEALAKDHTQTIVVLVGAFHNEYGGGLPDRLAARGIRDVLTITQYYAPNGKLGDLYNVIRPHKLYGKISDFVWIQGEPR